MQKTSSSDTFDLKTTDTMREKAKRVAKCAIFVMKFWRWFRCRIPPKKTERVKTDIKMQVID